MVSLFLSTGVACADISCENDGRCEDSVYIGPILRLEGPTCFCQEGTVGRRCETGMRSPINMVTSSYGNTLSITGPLLGESTQPLTYLALCGGTHSSPHIWPLVKEMHSSPQHLSIVLGFTSPTLLAIGLGSPPEHKPLSKQLISRSFEIPWGSL